ncbi:histidine kinase dimerization/phospho-acceptor domain-containing protein, partial [Salmonella enterica subsp. enterica serovar Infantis]
VRSGAPRDDVDELGGAFNVMLEEIGALVGQVRQVSTDIAHDLRTPLTRVRQRLDRLRRASSGNPELLASVERIDADIEEILRTFDSMLRLAE